MASVLTAARHRNGVSGHPFYVGIVADPFSQGDRHHFLVIHFPASDQHGEERLPLGRDSPCTAVLRLDLLTEGVVAAGLAPKGNSWRGDQVSPGTIGAIMAEANAMADALRTGGAT